MKTIALLWICMVLVSAARAGGQVAVLSAGRCDPDVVTYALDATSWEGGIGYETAFCDLDGDGLEDWVMGTSGGNPRVIAIFGGETVWGCRDEEGEVGPTPDVTVRTPSFNHGQLWLEACADMDGDGRDDLFAENEPSNGIRRFGGRERASWPREILVVPNMEGEVFLNEGTLTVREVMSIGIVTDWNGDGFEDFIVADQHSRWSTPDWQVRVYLGRPALPPFFDAKGVDGAPPDVRIQFREPQGAGTVLASGDLNGDGIQDLVLEVPRPPTDWRGRIFGFLGRRSFPPVLDGLGQADFVIEAGSSPHYHTDFQQIATGDFNGDGMDDLAVGDPAYGEELGPDRAWAGRILVFEGREDWPAVLKADRDEAWVALGGRPVPVPYPWGEVYANLGTTLAAGDWNGDGYDDLAASTYRHGDRNGGFDQPIPMAVWVSLGGPSMPHLRDVEGELGPPPDVKIERAEEDRSDGFGYSLAFGDFNGDGYDDLSVSAPRADGPSNTRDSDTGEAYLFFGSPDVGTHRVTASAGEDQVVECSSPRGTPVTLDGSGTKEKRGRPLTLRWTGPFPEGGGVVGGVSPTVTLPVGEHEITLDVSDGFCSLTDTVRVVVQDTIPPLADPLLGDPVCLWPPDHKWRCFGQGEDYALRDVCDESPALVSVAVSSSQEESGPGQGPFEPDWVVGTDGSFCLRSERDPRDPEGRLYTVAVNTRDASGNEGTSELHFGVPRGLGQISGWCPLYRGPRIGPEDRFLPPPGRDLPSPLPDPRDRWGR